MKIEYDAAHELLNIEFLPGVSIDDSIELDPGVIDYGKDKRIVAIEVLDASKRTTRKPLDLTNLAITLARGSEMNMSESFPSKKQMRSLMRRILSDEEVRFLTRRLAKAINSISGTFSFQDRLDLQDSIRFQAVATHLRERRQKSGMDLKAAAKAMGVPRYRLRDIEECSMKNLDASVLHRYVDFLGLKGWFTRWRKANPKLVADLLAKRESGDNPQNRKNPSRTGAKPQGTF